MNLQRFCLTVLFTAFALLSFSQSDSIGHISGSLNLKSSYNSSLIYPGARLGVEYGIKQISPAMYGSSAEKRNFFKDRFISANISWYHHPNFHDNFYLTAGWTTRKTKSTGFFTEFSPEIGLSRTFLGGTTYQIDNHGVVSIKKLAGYFYALLSVGGGVGYDFSKIKHKPFMLFCKFNLLAMYPYNSTIYLRPAIEIGLIYKLPHFHKLKPKE